MRCLARLYRRCPQNASKRSRSTSTSLLHSHIEFHFMFIKRICISAVAASACLLRYMLLIMRGRSSICQPIGMNKAGFASHIDFMHTEMTINRICGGNEYSDIFIFLVHFSFIVKIFRLDCGKINFYQ